MLTIGLSSPLRLFLLLLQLKLNVTGVDNRSHQTRVNGYQFVLAVARVAPALFAPTPCASVTVCDHPTPCASVTVCDAKLVDCDVI